MPSKKQPTPTEAEATSTEKTTLVAAIERAALKRSMCETWADLHQTTIEDFMRLQAVLDDIGPAMNKLVNEGLEAREGGSALTMDGHYFVLLRKRSGT